MPSAGDAAAAAASGKKCVRDMIELQLAPGKTLDDVIKATRRVLVLCDKKIKDGLASKCVSRMQAAAHLYGAKLDVEQPFEAAVRARDEQAVLACALHVATVNLE